MVDVDLKTVRVNTVHTCTIQVVHKHQHTRVNQEPSGHVREQIGGHVYVYNTSICPNNRYKASCCIITFLMRRIMPNSTSLPVYGPRIGENYTPNSERPLVYI